MKLLKNIKIALLKTVIIEYHLTLQYRKTPQPINKYKTEILPK